MKRIDSKNKVKKTKNFIIIMLNLGLEIKVYTISENIIGALKIRNNYGAIRHVICSQFSYLSSNCSLAINLTVDLLHLSSVLRQQKLSNIIYIKGNSKKSIW